jgi:hypothetical protein
MANPLNYLIWIKLNLWLEAIAFFYWLMKGLLPPTINTMCFWTSINDHLFHLFIKAIHHVTKKTLSSVYIW